jgi:hypothetical protein
MLISTTRTLRCINCIIPKLGTRIISDQRCSPLHPRLLQIASVERPARTQQQGLGGMAGEFPLNHDAGSDAQSWSSRPWRAWRAWRRNVTPQRTSPTLSRTSRVGGTPGTTNPDLVTTSTLSLDRAGIAGHLQLHPLPYMAGHPPKDNSAGSAQSTLTQLLTQILVDRNSVLYTPSTQKKRQPSRRVPMLCTGTYPRK